MDREQTKQAILGFTEMFKAITGNQDLKIPKEIAEKVELKQAEGEIPVMYYPQVDGITPTVVVQTDGEYISKDTAIDDITTGLCEGVACSECPFDEPDIICKVRHWLKDLPSVAIPNKIEIEAILQRFYNEEISCADMMQEMMNLGFVIER